MQNIILKSCQRAALASALALCATSVSAVVVEPTETSFENVPLGLPNPNGLNDEFATAIPLDASLTADGIIGNLTANTYNDRDFWSFTLTAGQTLGLTLTDPTGPGNNAGQFKPAIAIFDANQVPVGGLTTPGFTAGNTVGINYTPNASGVYYVMISSFQNEGILFGSSTSTLSNSAYWGNQFVPWSPQQSQGIGLSSWDYNLVLSGSGVGPGPNPVPVPAAVWLMASGLLGLVGVARRNKNT